MRMNNMTDEVSKRMAYYGDYIDLAIKHCETREDLLMVGSLMMTMSKKLFTGCFGDEETARVFMLDFLEPNISQDSLKKIV